MKRGPKIKDFNKWSGEQLEKHGFSPSIRESVFNLGLVNLLANSHHMPLLEKANERLKKALEVKMDYRGDVPPDDSADPSGTTVVDQGLSGDTEPANGLCPAEFGRGQLAEAAPDYPVDNGAD